MTQWLSASGLTAAKGDIATMVGAFTFVVFAVASMAQLVVGALLDRLGPRTVFMIVSAMQVVFDGERYEIEDVVEEGRRVSLLLKCSGTAVTTGGPLANGGV